MSNNKSAKRLFLSEKDKKLAGVCGGLGEYFGIDSTLVRVSWILVTIFTGFFPGIIAYIAAMLVIPKHPKDL